MWSWYDFLIIQERMVLLWLYYFFLLLLCNRVHCKLKPHNVDQERINFVGKKSCELNLTCLSIAVILCTSTTLVKTFKSSLITINIITYSLLLAHLVFISYALQNNDHFSSKSAAYEADDLYCYSLIIPIVIYGAIIHDSHLIVYRRNMQRLVCFTFLRHEPSFISVLTRFTRQSK